MAKARIVGKLDASQNLSTSPFTVSGLKGDTFDYTFMIFCDSAGASTGHLEITINSDTGSNYNRYYMRGLTSTPIANTSSGSSSAQIHTFPRNASSRNSFGVGILTGESGNERTITTQNSVGAGPRIYESNYYWTNTADGVDEITFTGTVSASYTWHIVVWEVPRTNLDGWEYVNKLDWSSETAEKSFSSLDGDTDIQFMISWEGDQELSVQCNNDGGSNYIRQYMQNASGTLSAANSTSQTSIVSDGINSRFLINAESGVDRLIYTSASNSSSAQQSQRAHWWQNTADSISSLDCTPSASASGTAKLYRKKLKPRTQTDLCGLPFETIEEYDVSGDFSAGQTTTIAGDDYLMLKIEWLGENTSGNVNLTMQTNADTGSNYGRQFLLGSNASTSAATSTGTGIFLGAPQNGNQSSGVMYLYPKSGEYRPTLNKKLYDEDTILFESYWWLNSADAITSIKVFADNTNSLTGKIRISGIRL